MFYFNFSFSVTKLQNFYCKKECEKETKKCKALSASFPAVLSKGAGSRYIVMQTPEALNLRAFVTVLNRC